MFPLLKRRQDASPSVVFPGGKRGLVCLLAFLSAFTPLSTDLYLPALPTMGEVFHVSAELINLTISLFMLFYALSMLLWGPLSDRYGRRPILFAGLGLYILASLICLSAGNVQLLILGRIFQAIGGGGVGAVAMAIVKDVFRGREMESLLAWIQTVMVLAPVLAPILGAFLLKLASWRSLFAMLMLCGVLGMAGVLLLRETHTERGTEHGLIQTFARIRTVLSQRRFRRLLVVFSLPVMPFMAYLTSSSYIYITRFGLTPQQYSLFFAFNAGMSVLGPMLYIRFFRDVSRHTLFVSVFLLLLADGIAILLFGSASPFVFTGFIVALSLSSNLIRPAATMLLMNLQEQNAGTVSSLIGSTGLLFGSTGMLLCSLPWPGFILAISVICTGASVLALSLWLLTERSRNS